MSDLTTHVLDTSRGRPAAGVKVHLEAAEGGGWRALAEGVTDADGRVSDLLAPEERLEAGTYRLSFSTGEYFETQGVEGFYPRVRIEFTVTRPGEHYHVPLLLNPFGYSTYRGS